MSRSRRKTPIRGIASNSDKWAKQLANRKLRSRVKTKLNILEQLTDFEDVYPLFPTIKEVSDIWGFPKDGKFFAGYENLTADYMRK